MRALVVVVSEGVVVMVVMIKGVPNGFPCRIT
jgi:hypothetical protein